jgi:TonB family protein
MSEPPTIVPKRLRASFAGSEKIVPEDPKQRKLMVGALCLLLLALGIVFWHDRDFWFPDAPEGESDQPTEISAPVQSAAPIAKSRPAGKPRNYGFRAGIPVAPVIQNGSASSEDLLPVAISSRTVLPPLEVEVIAGDTHRTMRPGSNSVRVDLHSGRPAQSIGEAGSARSPETATNIDSDPGERVQMSADTSEIVAQSVKPDYPLLARQMKVQGSVILHALIGKDGVIQNLRVVSGPHILASAAQDAVLQWHFKPHLQGSEAVETQAKITVNFTISTN